MHLIALSLIVQIACAVHCVRNRGNNLWLTVIIFLSIPGCLAYFLFEVLPQLSARREVRSAARAAAMKLDPERDIRAARDALELADTAANRSALGDALAAREQWAEAIEHYDAAMAKAPKADRAARVKLAAACLEGGEPERARDLLAALPASAAQSENDRIKLLLAQALEASGDAAGALAIYGEIGERIAGGEAQCRRAALLLRLGRRTEALFVLDEVARRMKRLSRHQRAQAREMYDWAARTRAELRGPGAQAGS